MEVDIISITLVSISNSKSFGEIPWAREERYPILDEVNTALAYLEMALLRDALAPAYARDRARLEGLVRLFAAVRKERWEKGPPFVRSYEQGQEIREGTAQYVQMRCVDLLKDLDYRSSVNGRGVRDALKDLSPLAIRSKDFETRMKGNTVQPDDMIRNRIYPVGATLGFLADVLGISGRTRPKRRARISPSPKSWRPDRLRTGGPVWPSSRRSSALTVMKRS